MYFGTFSKTMFPALRIGFTVAPKELIDDMANYRAVTDHQTNALSQRALAGFIETGAFEKHVHRMRRIYARKRRCLSDAIAAAGLPGKLTGTDTGLNGLVRLTARIPAAEVAQAAAARGLCVTPISRYATSRRRDDALVLGYGALSHAEIEEGIGVLSRLVREPTSP